MANKALAAAALKKAAELKKSKQSKPQPSTKETKKVAKKTAPKTERKQRASRASDADLNKVAKMYDAGKTAAEISDAMGWTDEKSNWPYSYAYGILKRLRAEGKVNPKREK